MASRKDGSIESLRGLAILLVILGYVTVELGRSTAFTGGLSFLYHCLTPIRLPLFTVISGYLYASSPACRDSFAKLTQGKARRILLPFLSMSAIQYSVYAFFRGQPTPAGFVDAYLEPSHQLWFLLAVFWIFLIVGALDAFGALSSFRRWAAATAATTLLHLFTDLPSFLAMGGVVYLLPFFLLGYGFRRHEGVLLKRQNLKALIGVAVAAYGVFAVLYFRQVPKPVYEALGTLISFSVLPVMFILRRSYAILAMFGNFAFVIHLFSYLGILFAQYALDSAGIGNELLRFVGAMGIVLGLPMLLQAPLERWNLSRRFLLGMRPRSGDDEPISIPYRIPYKMPVQWKRQLVTMDRQFFHTRPGSKRRAHIRTLQKQLADI